MNTPTRSQVIEYLEAEQHHAELVVRDGKFHKDTLREAERKRQILAEAVRLLNTLVG